MRREFIEEAYELAERSPLKISNHGAVVLYRGKIVGRGYNKQCIENINKVNRFSVHAEVDAINNALRKISFDDLKKSTLIVVRKMKKVEETQHPFDGMGLSAPCPCCTRFINRCQIKKIYYS